MLGNQLKSLDFNILSTCFDKVVMKEVYTVMDSCCPNLERLSLGQSFFFSPDLISDLSSKLHKFNKEHTLFLSQRLCAGFRNSFGGLRIKEYLFFQT